jgi:hypothetical protein
LSSAQDTVDWVTYSDQPHRYGNGNGRDRFYKKDPPPSLKRRKRVLSPVRWRVQTTTHVFSFLIQLDRHIDAPVPCESTRVHASDESACEWRLTLLLVNCGSYWALCSSIVAAIQVCSWGGVGGYSAVYHVIVSNFASICII